MLTLRELQTQFAHSMFAIKNSGDQYSGENNAVLSLLRADSGITQQRGMVIYRNDVFHNLSEALRAVFPVVCRLVGTGFFDHVADRFIAARPSRSGNLHHFGEDFPEFLADFDGARELAYLPDTARLEWLMHDAFHAADHAVLDPARLAGIESDDYPTLCFRLHPACSVLASPYPIDHIWQFNQSAIDSDETLDADGGGVCLLLRRPQFTVELQRISSGEFALLASFAAAANLAAASAAASLAEPDFDLGACLCARVADATLIDFA